MGRDQIRDEALVVIARHSKATLDAVLAAESIQGLVDSMAIIGIVFELEEKYGVEIDDTEILEFESVDDIIDSVFRQLATAA